MADNFDMKKFLIENQTGPYAKAKLTEGEAAYEYEKGKAAGEKEEKEKLQKEDLGKDIEDAEAEKEMDFLAEYEVIYVYGEDGKCYRKDDEGNYDQVDRSYCQRYAGTGVREEKEEEGYMGTQYDSSEDMAVDMLKKGITETVDNHTLGKVEQVLDMLSHLKSNTSTNSNIPTTDKQGLVYAFQEMEDVLEDVAADIEMEMNEGKEGKKEQFGGVNEGEDVFADIDDDLAYGTDSKEDAIEYLEDIIDYCQKKIVELENEQGYEEEDEELDEAIDAKSFGGILKSDNPEGDALVLRFLQGIAKKFEYPVSHAAMFVKERIKKLGY